MEPSFDPGLTPSGDVVYIGRAENSNIVIGRGARQIIYQVHQTLSAVDEREKDIAAAERRLAQEIERKLSRYTALPAQTAAAAHANPYMALLDYKPEDASFFYGRSEALSALQERLDRRQLTVLQSASGSGKTSLLQAGLTVQLLSKSCFPLRLRPYRQPPGLVIRRAFLPDLETQEELARFRPDRMSLRGFLETVTRTLGGVRLYLLLDQFEEFFTELDPAQQTAFAAELQECIESDLPVWWVIALSKEYFADLRVFDRIRPFENQYFLEAFSRAEAREVITAPAQRLGVTFEDGVVARILDDLGRDDARLAPPEVQLVCYTLFAERNGGNITHALYDRPRGRTNAPGAAGILTDHLARVVQRDLPPGQRPLAKRVLEALVTSDRRRRVISHDRLLSEFTPDVAEPVDSILDVLARNRLLRVDSDDSQDPIFELAHDYLLDEIVIDPETKVVKEAAELLARGVEDYRHHQTLLSKERFDIISVQRAHLVLDAESATLLDLSQAQLAAVRQRQRRVAGGAITIVLALTLLASWLALRSRTLAGQVTESVATAESAFAVTEAERQRADLKAAEAGSRDLIASASALGDDEAALSSLLYIEAGRLANAPEVIGNITQGVSDLAIPLLTLSHDGWINGVAWNDDESRLLSWSNDHTAAIWDAETGQRLHTLAHQGEVEGAAWSGDDGRVLTWSGDSVTIWDAATAKPLHTLAHDATLLGAAWNNDDRLILTWHGVESSGDSSAAVWDAGSGERLYDLVHEFDVPETGVVGAAWSGDGRYLLTWGENTAAVWDAATGTHLFTAAHNQGLQLSGATWSADSSYVLTWSKDDTARLWPVTMASSTHTLPHDDDVLGAVSNQSGSQVLTWSSDNTAVVWDAATGERLFALAHPEALRGAAWSADESRILTWGTNHEETVVIWDATNGSRGNEIHPSGSVGGAITNAANDRVLTWNGSTAAVWNMAPGELILRLEHDLPVERAVWSTDGSRILTYSRDGTAIVWDAVSGERLPTLEYINGRVEGAGWSESGAAILSWHSDGTAAVWNVSTGESRHTLQPESRIVGATWNGNGSHILTWADDGALLVWDSSTGERGQTLRHDMVKGAVWNADQSRILSWGTDDTAVVWDALTGEALLPLTHEGDVNGASWNADETRILTWSGDTTIVSGAATIWDAVTGQRVLLLPHDSPVGGAAWNHDESRLLTWRDNQSYSSPSGALVEVWDGQSGRRLLTLTHEAMVYGAMWNAADDRILTWSNDGTTAVWDAISGEHLLALASDGFAAGADYNSDESRILTWSDISAVVWDTETGQRVQVLPGELRVTTAAWSPDESQIMVVANNKILRYYTQLGAMLSAACERVSRNLSWEEWRLYLPGEAYRCTCPNLPAHPSVFAADDAVISESTVCAPE